MRTASETLSILVRNQDRRYWRHLQNNGTPQTFYALPLEVTASRLIDEARVAYEAARVTSL